MANREGETAPLALPALRGRRHHKAPITGRNIVQIQGGHDMRLTKLAIAAATAMAVAAPAFAGELVMPLLSYRTGP